MRLFAVFLLFVALAGCVTNNERRISPDNLAPFVRGQAFRDQPKLNPETIIKIEEYRVDALWEALKIQVLGVRTNCRLVKNSRVVFCRHQPCGE